MGKACRWEGCDRGCYGEFCILHKQRKPIKKQGKHAELWKEARAEWFLKHPPVDGYYECGICHQPVPAEETFLDHIIPRSNKPSLRYDMNNLQPSHWKCNSDKGSKHQPVDK